MVKYYVRHVLGRCSLQRVEATVWRTVTHATTDLALFGTKITHPIVSMWLETVWDKTKAQPCFVSLKTTTSAKACRKLAISAGNRMKLDNNWETSWLWQKWYGCYAKTVYPLENHYLSKRLLFIWVGATWNWKVGLLFWSSVGILYCILLSSSICIFVQMTNVSG